jgi:hypothetical protein
MFKRHKHTQRRGQQRKHPGFAVAQPKKARPGGGPSLRELGSHPAVRGGKTKCRGTQLAVQLCFVDGENLSSDY